jgi:putative NIF3 family GTP cyclohydrolase 1 type 2
VQDQDFPTLAEFYKSAIDWGIQNDPRGKEAVGSSLQKQRKNYEKLDQTQKNFFDKEKFTNPYSDTRILHGNPDQRIRSLFVGIDIEIAEVLLADRIRSSGKSVDLILAHHPEGRAMANFYEVMEMQADILNRFGVPINVAEGILEDRIKEVERRILPVNHTRAVDAARLLDLPFLCVHTPADNGVTQFLQKEFDERKPVVLSDIIDFLLELPEYQERAKTNAGPKIVAGSSENRTGKIFVDMTGGTGGSKKAFEKLVQAGVGTVVGMHIGEDHLKEAKKNHVNVVIAGHISSDTLGMNLLLDSLIREHGPLDVSACSGFIRFSRI